MRSAALVALAASVSSVAAVSQGFNYGSSNADGTPKNQQTFEAEFTAAKGLAGTSGGFTSARLYTMVDAASSTDDPISAIPAAISTNTELLLGLWASGGENGINSELIALNKAIQQYGSAFADLVVGISVGSEDLYRASELGQEANAGIGADASVVSSYIGRVKQAIQGTPLAGKPVGHVDTWTAWVDGANTAVIDAADWIGFDAYPYFQNTMDNPIGRGQDLFEEALAATQSAVGSKDIWITETGWPVSGKTENRGVPSLENAKTYWDIVGCPRFGKVNVWWYTFQDSVGITPNPSFGVIGSTVTTTPLYDLSCSNITTSSSSSSASASSTASASASSLSSAASSLSTAATGGGVVSSGSGLSPSQAGIPSSNNATATGGSGGSPATPTGGASNSSVTTAGQPAPTGSSLVSANSASVLSGSVMGMGAVFLIAFLAL